MGVRPSRGQQPSLPCCAVEVSLNDRLASHRLGVSLSTRRRPCVGVSQTGSRRGLQQERLTKQPEESQLPRRVGGRESLRSGQPAPRGPHPLRQAARRPCDVQPAQSLLSHGNVSMLSPPGGTDPTLNWGVLQPPATCEVLGSESLQEVVPVSLWHPRPVGCSACARDAHSPGLKHPRGHRVWAGTPTSFPLSCSGVQVSCGPLTPRSGHRRPPSRCLQVRSWPRREGHGQAVGPRPRHQPPAHWLMEREGCDLEGEAPQSQRGGSQWFMENFSL